MRAGCGDWALDKAGRNDLQIHERVTACSVQRLLIIVSWTIEMRNVGRNTGCIKKAPVP